MRAIWLLLLLLHVVALGTGSVQATEESPVSTTPLAVSRPTVETAEAERGNVFSRHEGDERSLVWAKWFGHNFGTMAAASMTASKSHNYGTMTSSNGMQKVAVRPQKLGCVALLKKRYGSEGSKSTKGRKLKGSKSSYDSFENALLACRERRQRIRMRRRAMRRAMMMASPPAMRPTQPVMRPTPSMNMRPTPSMNMRPPSNPPKKCCRDSAMNAYGIFSGTLDDSASDVSILYSPEGIRVVYDEGCGNENTTITEISTEPNLIIWTEQFDFNLNNTCIEGENATLTKIGAFYNFQSAQGTALNLNFKCVRLC
jgi:hypothetical protein